MTDLAQTRACEERLVNLWPSVDTLMMGDWVLRMAHGYSGRANSASALRAGAALFDHDLRRIVALYRAAGLPPAIRVTPLAENGLPSRLEAQGWRVRTHSIGMIAPLEQTPAGQGTVHDTSITFTDTAEESWLAGVSRLQEPSKSNPQHLAAIVGRIRLPKGFATVHRAGQPVGFGMAALDRGMAEMGSIILAPEVRGQGLGRQLLRAMMGWAALAGAEQVFLQVEAGNQVARALYRSLGYAEVYPCTEYRLLPVQDTG